MSGVGYTRLPLHRTRLRAWVEQYLLMGRYPEENVRVWMLLLRGTYHEVFVIGSGSSTATHQGMEDNRVGFQQYSTTQLSPLLTPSPRSDLHNNPSW